VSEATPFFERLWPALAKTVIQSETITLRRISTPEWMPAQGR
jgi:hypothetical protein